MSYAVRSLIVKLVLLGCCSALLGTSRANGQQPFWAIDGQDPFANPPTEMPPVCQSADPVCVIDANLPPTQVCVDPVEETYTIWGRADWWLGWIRGERFPALVTAGPSADTLPGALGQEGTAVRFGGDPTPQVREGGRIALGTWFDPDNCFGVEVGGFFLSNRNIDFALSSPGVPAVARPFFNVLTQQQDASLVSFPGFAAGTITAQSGTRLYGADFNFVMALNSDKEYPVRMLVGARYLNLHDDLNIAENVQVNATAPVDAGQQIGVRDGFSCDNNFLGGNLGLTASYNIRRLELEATAQCAVGVCQEYVSIAGGTLINNNGTYQSFPAGLLAVSSNSGNHVRNVFGVVPEADLEARFEVTRHVIVSTGYSFLYWNSVARAGNEIDTNINPNLVPTSKTYGQTVGPQQPQSSVQDSEFWVHGVHFGLELRF